MAWKNGQPEPTGESINEDGDLDKPARSVVNGMGNATAGKVMEGKPQHQKMTDKMSKSWGCG